MQSNRCLLMMVLAALLLVASPLRAQTEPVEALPEAVQLTGLKPTWQQYNRCSAAAFFMLISYYGWQGSYSDMISALNPHPDDVNVRLEEMVAFAEQQGLAGIIRTAGTITLLKRLTAAGFPVLVETAYYEGAPIPKNWMSHNRVITGYDEAAGALYAFDSLLGFGADGRGRPLDYLEFDAEWHHFNRNYLILYWPADAVLLQALLGDHWDAERNAEATLAQADRDLTSPDYANSPFSLLNRSAALLALGRLDEAAQAVDAAQTIGLPWRSLWYRFEPFEIYLQVGRYEDVIALARQVLATTPGAEEIYYYAGRAYEALGDPAKAEANYRAAIQRNKYYAEAISALAALTGG